MLNTLSLSLSLAKLTRFNSCRGIREERDNRGGKQMTSRSMGFFFLNRMRVWGFGEELRD
jgi:hypothetical protein